MSKHFWVIKKNSRNHTKKRGLLEQINKRSEARRLVLTLLMDFCRREKNARCESNLNKDLGNRKRID